MTGKTEDKKIREILLARLYSSYLSEGLYRGVISLKEIARELEIDSHTLERNIEYLLDRNLVRMHKIEDLVSISPDGVDWVESPAKQGSDSKVLESLERIEKLLEAIERKL